MKRDNRAFERNKDSGLYTATLPLSSEDIVAMAKKLLGRRFRRGSHMRDPAMTKNFAEVELASTDREIFAAIFLDNRHRVIAFEKLFFGTIDNTTVYPRVVVKRALDHNAAAVVFAHNHPSGNTDPSEADRLITRRLVDSLELIDVRVLDHIVVGSDPPTSLAERGWL
ncbi:MAG: DNA repair protein RadC [Proteobacteria bacterium]|nr:MAG: DNA repair protein RadC [Pseudomonadota bacterium]